MKISEPARRAPTERRMLSAAVDPEVVAELQRRASEQDRSASSLVRQALRQFLQDHGNGHQEGDR